MVTNSPFETHVEEYEAWFEDNQNIYESELLAIRTMMERLPENILGIEVGLGTGRYAGPLGIKEGVEPSANMREIAIKKGIEVMDAKAERLPYKDLHFDFVLFVTVCHLDDIEEALDEAYRVLKHIGTLIIGFIDKKSTIGKKYEEKKNSSVFYRSARFYSPEQIASLLKERKFKNLEFLQTVFDDGEPDNVHIPREGFGEGSFVVVKASK